MIVSTENFYIATDEAILGGEPIIKDTRTPVRAIVELYRLGIAPEEIPTHLPHLNLAQIFAALSYYRRSHRRNQRIHFEKPFGRKHFASAR